MMNKVEKISQTLTAGFICVEFTFTQLFDGSVLNFVTLMIKR